MVELGGDQSLSIAASDAIAAKWGATVVLIAGEHNVGKTTLLAELYGRFLKGQFAGWSYAGSECLIALDRRYHGARGAGPGPPDIDHTVDEDMRLIDLRLRLSTGSLASLLLSDIQGEFVRQVIEGAPPSEELPLAARADRTAVLIDGEKVAGLYTRQEAITRARVLIGALTDPGGLQQGRPMAIVLTKGDQLDEHDLEWFVAEAANLCSFAESRGAHATTVVTAARPEPAPNHPEGLEDFLAWLVAPITQRNDLAPRTIVREPDRSFWAMRGGKD
jgi:hypothetical protein